MPDTHTPQQQYDGRAPTVVEGPGAKPRHWVKQYRTEIAASSSSILSTIAAYPLDSVKTRMQVYKFQHFTDCVQHTYRTEGVKGFWRGCMAPLASITLVRTVSFSIYQKAKYSYSAWLEKATGTSPLVLVNTPGSYPTLTTMSCFAAAGATAGAAITTIACPFELTKLTAQIQVLMGSGTVPNVNAAVVNTYKNKGTFQTARSIIRNKGVLGLYSGFHLHLMRDTLGTAIYFTTYESAKQLLMTSRGSSPTSPLSVVVAGGLCGLVSWALIYPIDSAKSIYQRNCLTRNHDSMERESRPKIEFFNRRMYRGLGVSMSRSCIVNAIFFSSFEFIKKQINQAPD